MEHVESSNSSSDVEPPGAKGCPRAEKKSDKKCQRRCNQCGKVYIGTGTYCPDCNDDIIV